MGHAIPKAANTPDELRDRAGQALPDLPKQEAGWKPNRDTPVPEILDRALKAKMAKITRGLSPAAL